MSGYVLTEQAERDLNEIWDYIASESIEQADAVVADIRAALELLAVPFIPNPSPPRAAGCGAENNGLVSFVPWWFNRID